MSDQQPFDPLTQFTAGELGKWMEAAAVDGGVTEATARRLLMLGSMVLMKFPQARVILDAQDYSSRMHALFPNPTKTALDLAYQNGHVAGSNKRLDEFRRAGLVPEYGAQLEADRAGKTEYYKWCQCGHAYHTDNPSELCPNCGGQTPR